MSFQLDLKNAGIEKVLLDSKVRALDALDKLCKGTGEGSEFTDWVCLPKNYDKEEFRRIKEAAKKIRENSEVFVSIGIGGSYLGARAVVEALSTKFKKEGEMEIIFAGKDISSTELSEILDYLEDKDYAINVISKSGTTTEPAIAFRMIKAQMSRKYTPEELKERIFITTDKERGALKTLADEMGYETFVVPDGVGGRYSVLTAVGLLPIAAAGFDIDALMEGAADGMERFTSKNFQENEALRYASARYILGGENKDIEILVNYEPKLAFVSEWWKQLFGESEGKDGKGIFPASVNFTSDLHSMGQMIQQGKRNIFETVIAIENPLYDLEILPEDSDLDGLNYLAGKTVDYVNKKAMEGTMIAHVEGEVPNIKITIDRLDEYNLGKLLYFFEISCGISGYMINVNPFDQPGVEFYKKNMFKLLGKPGV